MNSADIKNIPVPQGKYVPASRSGNLVFSAGMTPRVNGVLILCGKVRADEPLIMYKDAVRQAAANALNAVLNSLSQKEHIEKVLLLNVYINAQDGFESHSKLADFASDYLFEKLGEAGIGSRAAVGVASLPGNAPVEIRLVAAISSGG
ncbi:MAG: Endoribonuclease L-PSP [Firmicutes bacterium ADurb.Bin182]|nr:MAG: Endoribonuclease L-PSP [Firmicutes bacterium ADurb.Bin182]